MKSIYFLFLVLLVQGLVVNGTAVAGDQAGVLTQVQGSVELLTHPGKVPSAPSPRVNYEGQTYSIRKARLGDKLENGFLVRTGADGKSRVVYQNGDHFNVGSNSAYRISWKEEKKGSTNLNLFYGKIRAVVAKEGDRNKMTVKTPTAVAGVRGTDFFVESQTNATKLSVLRGEVGVKSNAPAAKEVKVANGHVVDVKSPPPVAEIKAAAQEVAKNDPEAAKSTEALVKKAQAEAAKAAEKPPIVELRKTTQEELVEIQKESTVKTAENLKDDASDDVKKQLATLETKAVENTMADIKVSDPKLYAQIKEKGTVDINEVNTAQVAEKFKEAPKSLKPVELEGVGEDVYKKYFKVE